MHKIVLTGVLAVVLAACAVSPMGRQQFTLLSEQQLDSMGAQSFQELKQTERVDTNPSINRYVQCVANAITAELGGSRPWEVVVFRNSAASAFALPGGKIGVYTGLLKVAVNQHQLAAVIGHEVGHVVANHANERVSQEFAVQGGLGILGATAGANMGPGTQQALGLGAQVGILLPFSRVQESEADIIGLDLMARAGFDPRQSLALWQNMDRAGGSQPPQFLSTHPSHGTRVSNLQNYMGQAMQVYEAARRRGRHPHCQ
ncbi:MAG: M48 family metallopeptidase [Gammaproteobacteria bacterium]|nr:M48 family metallopeptidase [Gammaproteobacteria bacterium]MCP5424450.1 M48 family metallopeptidase [Gammaproteobacteria bacterium]MCP5458444.1 M48 family metallopeptidase [Gammaproteobacteria bacterium]